MIGGFVTASSDLDLVFVYDVPPGVNLHRLDTLDLPVSSSDIRRALAAGERPAEVPASVLEYTDRHRLYK